MAGDGPRADKIRGAYARFGGEVPQNSVGKLRDARNTIARSMINLDFCEERKVLAGGKHENSGAGSKVEASFSLAITPQELDRLAAVDYSKYDGARMTQHVLDPNAERPYETVRQVLDQDFRFASDNDAVTCRTGYKITVA